MFTMYSGSPSGRFLKAVKTQTKCSVMLHFINSYTVCEGKTAFHTKTIFVFENQNMTRLDIYHGLLQVYCIKPEGRIYLFIKGCGICFLKYVFHIYCRALRIQMLLKNS